MLDIFAGSNATGEAAEEQQRKWVAFESERRYLAESAFRFIEEMDVESIKSLYRQLLDPTMYNIEIGAAQQPMDLWKSAQSTHTPI